MSEPARRLIINADDFGLSAGVNQGILEAHIRGVVTSTSLMVYGAAAERAAADARRHRELSVGLHFVEDGTADLDDHTQLTRAFKQQLERFRALVGADPTHVDSHHHVHAEEDRLSAFADLTTPLGVPLRHDGRIAHVGGFYGQWEYGVTDLAHVRAPFLLHLVATEVPEGVTELACHPARVIGDFNSLYLNERAVELQTLTTPGLRDDIEALGVQLVSFHDVSRWPRGPRRAR
jgi:chitin disaccharide deacetylase